MQEIELLHKKESANSFRHLLNIEVNLACSLDCETYHATSMHAFKTKFVFFFPTKEDFGSRDFSDFRERTDSREQIISI